MAPSNQENSQPFHEKAWLWLVGLISPAKAVHTQTVRVTEILGETARIEPEATLLRVNSRPEGLSNTEAAERQEQYGKNVVAREERRSVIGHLLRLLINPLNVMLLVLALTNFLFLDDIESGSIVSAMVILSVSLCFIQERRSG